MRPRKRDEKGRPLEDPESSLARRIQIWAQTWRRCPKKGCRRASRCLKFNDCAGVEPGSYWPTEEDQRRYFRPFMQALRAHRGGRRKYDPDARDRNRPMPPAPPRC